MRSALPWRRRDSAGGLRRIDVALRRTARGEDRRRGRARDRRKERNGNQHQTQTEGQEGGAGAWTSGDFLAKVCRRLRGLQPVPARPRRRPVLQRQGTTLAGAAGVIMTARRGAAAACPPAEIGAQS